VNNPGVSSTWTGKQVTLSDGYELIGFRAWTDDEGFISWIDFKAWKPIKA